MTSKYTIMIPSQIDAKNADMFQPGVTLYWPNRGKITPMTVCAIRISRSDIIYDVTHEDDDPIQSFTLKGLSLNFMRTNFFRSKHDAEKELTKKKPIVKPVRKAQPLPAHPDFY